jgi:hypothetical protein
MPLDEPLVTLQELLNQAAAASSLGDREEAERLYRRATERSPYNTQAWLGLAAAVPSTAAKRACYEQVLAINPHNGEARAALQRLASQADPATVQAIEATLAGAAARRAAEPPPPAAVTAVAVDHEHVAVESGETLVCVNHPDTETTLRCNRCGRPVCVRCVELTEVGYRCKDCIREQQNTFFTAVSTDYVIVAVVSFLLAAVAAPLIEVLLGIFGLFLGIILAVVLGPAVGGTAATIIRRSVGRRRGRYMGIVAVVAIILGMLVGVLVGAMVFGLRIGNLIPLLVFLFLALSTIYATLR